MRAYRRCTHPRRRFAPFCADPTSAATRLRSLIPSSVRGTSIDATRVTFRWRDAANLPCLA